MTAPRLLPLALVGGLVLAACSLTAPVRAADPLPADEQTLRAAGVAADGPGLLAFFRARTPRDEDLRALVKKLGDDDFEVREQASRDLVRLGTIAEPYLREAARSGDPEVVRRAEEALKSLGSGPSAAVVAAAARTLAARRPPGAAEALLAFLPRIEGEAPADEVLNALARLALRDGKPEPALVTALADATAATRSAAAVALARGGAADALPAVRKLLADADPHVRLRVALALAARRDKDAVPVLIDLVGLLPAAEAIPAEDLLYRLADDRAPDVPAGRDPGSRQKARDAWARWWKDEQGKIDLARLDAPGRLLGYTMMVHLDANRIVEIDAAGKVRWQIDGLEFPLDAQLLPGERVLVAEHQGNRVTERNRKGEVLWQKLVDGPLVAQRLPGGNTLIATRLQVIEVDPSGKQVLSHFRPQGDLIMKAQKTRTGALGLVVASLGNNTGQFVLLDATGKETASFPVSVRTSGGRIDLLPNGRVLVPLKDAGKVVEYDLQGKSVWEVNVPDPVAAVRLPNGHTLITAYQSTKVVEVDAAGKTVWEHDAGTRVTRAWRR